MKKLLTLLLVIGLLLPALPTLAQEDGSGLAALVPSEAPFYVSLNTRPGFEIEIESLVAKLSQQPVEGMLAAQGLDPLTQTLLANQEATFADDIRPWLGDEIAVTLTQMPPLATFIMASSGTPPPVNLVVLIEVTDADAAQAFLDKALDNLVSMTGLTRTETSVGDVDIVQLEGESPPVVNFGIVENALVIGLGTTTFVDIIAVAEADMASLAEQRGFARIYNDMDPNSALRIYTGPALYTGIIRDPFVWRFVEQGIESGELDLSTMGLDISDPEELRTQARAVAATIDGLAIGFSGRSNALVMDIVAGFDLEALAEVTGQPIEMVETKINPDIFTMLPPDTTGVFAATNLAGLYNDIVAGVSLANPAGMQEFNRAVEQFERALGQNIEDLLAWLEGTFALAFTPNLDYDPQNPNDIPIKLVFVFEVTDQEKAQATFDALANVAERERVEAEISEVDGVQVLSVITPEDIQIQFAIVEGYFVVATSDAAEKVIETAQSGESYRSTARWERVTGIANARGPLFATLEMDGLVELSKLQAQTFDSMGDVEMMGEIIETYGFVAPGAEEGGPAHITLFITLAE